MLDMSIVDTYNALFINEEPEAQKDYIICPRPNNKKV